MKTNNRLISLDLQILIGIILVIALTYLLFYLMFLKSY